MLVQQEKQAAFGLLAAGIAHEVGNPLAAISSLVQLLNRRNIEAETREKLSLVDDQLRRIQRTLRELVDFSRPAIHVKTRCDVHATIDAALNIAKYYKRKKGKQIVTKYVENVPLMMIVHDQLVQVFLNLVLNAMDAMPEGGTLTLGAKPDGDKIEIRIADTGEGLTPEECERLFTPYYTTKQHGTGLGLAIVQSVVADHAGTIAVESRPGGGAVFVITLPKASS